MKTFLEPLSPEKEAEYLQCMKNGEKLAKDELILHNMRLVAHVAKRYAGAEEDIEDLISIGTIGLIKAVLTFDKDYGSRFATYAIRCIDIEILLLFRSRKITRGEVSMFEPIGTDKEGNQIHLFDILEGDEKDIAGELERSNLCGRAERSGNRTDIYHCESAPVERRGAESLRGGNCSVLQRRIKRTAHQKGRSA